MIDKPLGILLVDDSKTDALLIRKLVLKALPHGSAVHTAPTLAAAIPMIAEEEYHTVLLDLLLPDTLRYSGLQTIQNMAPNLPIVILTSQGEEDMALGSIERGAQDYLYKNEFTSAALKRVIHYAIRRKSFEGYLITRANFDPLTGAANRLLFESRLDMALARHERTGENVCVFFLDLDRFKQVNDEHGHMMGDAVLQMTAERLQELLRPYDTVARFGGDEFALLVEGIENLKDCRTIAEKTAAAIHMPYHILGKTLDIGVSIGISACTRDNNCCRAELMKQADEAMYAAKMAAVDHINFYLPVAKSISA